MTSNVVREAGYEINWKGNIIMYYAIEFFMLYHFHYANIMMVIAHCGIFIVHGGPMFVDFVGHPNPRIYILTNCFHIHLCHVFVLTSWLREKINLSQCVENCQSNQIWFGYCIQVWYNRYNGEINQCLLLWWFWNGPWLMYMIIMSLFSDDQN